MSILESVFSDIERLSREAGRQPLSPASTEEILMVMALTPILRMNLRAQMDQEVTITDASPLGAGGGVAEVQTRTRHRR